MRKTLAILLISVHLFGNTEAGQLLKFPQLLQHFFQHHQIDPSISFFQFIAMHLAAMTEPLLMMTLTANCLVIT